VVAEDNANHRSVCSNVIDVIVAIGGYVQASNYEFPTQIGDTLLYQVTNVESENLNANKEPLMTFFYHSFVKGTQFEFWVQEIDRNQVYPIVSVFSARNPYAWDNKWYIVDDLTPATIFTLSTNRTYQLEVFALFVKNEIGASGMNNRTYETLWHQGSKVYNVYVYTFYGPVDGDGRQTSVSFYVEEQSGVLCEMVVYNKDLSYGYSIQLLESSLELVSNNWQYAPIYLGLGLVAVGVFIAWVIKKVEY
jgi:hypothetical protein